MTYKHTGVNNPGSSMPRSGQGAEYDPNSYKMGSSMGQFYSPSSQLYLQNNPANLALFRAPNDGTNSLYVDGVPIDSHEREVSHIFRPFPGFCCIRLIKKTALNGREFYLCFADFENVLCASIAMATVQGYRFDKSDKIGLKISYAKESKQFKDKNNRRYQ